MSSNESLSTCLLASNTTSLRSSAIIPNPALGGVAVSVGTSSNCDQKEIKFEP
jgi:hypothetical protein